MKPNEDDVIRIIEGITEIDNDLVIEADLFTVNSDQLKKRKMRNEVFRIAAISFCVVSLFFSIRLLLTKAFADEKKYSSKSDKTESDPWKVQEQSANGGESNIIIDYPEPEWFSDAVAEQEKAVEAHEILFEALNLNEKRDYPDDFGGDFIDGGKLYICVTSEESIAKYRRILEDNPVVEYKIVKHSRNEIQQQVDSFVEEHKDEFVFYTYGVDVVNNCGVITTSDEYVEEMKKLLVGTGIVVNRGIRVEED